MKKSLFFTIVMMAFIIPSMLYAQNNVSLTFTDGIADGNLKRTMERNASKLLTAINIAEAKNSDINYSGINIDNLASQSIGSMWNNVHMRISDDSILEHCLCIKSRSGAVIAYQVRNIAVEMKPLKDGYEGSVNQEVTIEFNKHGGISDFNIALGINGVGLFKDGNKVEDYDRRMQILHWVEQFRNAYVQKDINFMENVFSEDALIITGKRVKRVASDIKSTNPAWEYTVQNKRQYIDKLKGIFNRNLYINVKFDEITVVRHPTNPNIYGVTLKQGWHTKSYSDEGIVFIVWDFTDEMNPKILVRTWQAKDDTNKTFDLNDFKI